jgi:hypothetical protein
MRGKIRYTLLAAPLLLTCKGQVVVDPRPHEIDEGALTVSLRTMVTSQNGDERPVVEGETLHSGDRVFFMVRVSQPAYLYLVLFGPDGSANVLFPKDATKEESVPARCPLRIPQAGLLYLQQPTGAEDVRVVASAEPLAKLDRRLCEQLRLPCQKTDAGPARPLPCPTEGTRSIFSSVKLATAGERGVASLRMGFKHDQ